MRRLSPVALLAGLLAACAPVIHGSGAPIQSWAAARGWTFVLAEDPGNDGGAGTAVAHIPETKGLKRATDAPYRVDVALSVSDPRISLASGAPSHRPLSLCRRWRYSLSVAMIDRRQGTVLFRRGAETQRCGELTPELVDRLVVTVLGG